MVVYIKADEIEQVQNEEDDKQDEISNDAPMMAFM